MDLMTVFVLSLVLIVVAGAAVGTVYMVLTKYMEAKQMSKQMDWRAKRSQEYLPIQMQAYERLILLLERMHPERLVFRVNKPGMSARLMQAEVLKLIREEYDHNLTQQLYISNEAWQAVSIAREETLRILNMAAEKTDKDATSIEFSTAILELVGKLKKTPTEAAIDILKGEFRRKMKE